MLILGQNSCFLGPTVYKIQQKKTDNSTYRVKPAELSQKFQIKNNQLRSLGLSQSFCRPRYMFGLILKIDLR